MLCYLYFKCQTLFGCNKVKYSGTERQMALHCSVCKRLVLIQFCAQFARNGLISVAVVQREEAVSQSVEWCFNDTFSINRLHRAIEVCVGPGTR